MNTYLQKIIAVSKWEMKGRPARFINEIFKTSTIFFQWRWCTDRPCVDNTLHSSGFLAWPQDVAHCSNCSFRGVVVLFQFYEFSVSSDGDKILKANRSIEHQYLWNRFEKFTSSIYLRNRWTLISSRIIVLVSFFCQSLSLPFYQTSLGAWLAY